MDFPKEVLMKHKLSNNNEYESWLKKLSNKSVKLIVPKIGDKKSLVEICEKNCQLQLKEILNKKQKRKSIKNMKVQEWIEKYVLHLYVNTLINTNLFVILL